MAKKKTNSKEENITNESSILAPYNSIISENDDNLWQRISIKTNNSFDDFKNNKIKLENELIAFSIKKLKNLIDYMNLIIMEKLILEFLLIQKHNLLLIWLIEVIQIKVRMKDLI